MCAAAAQGGMAPALALGAHLVVRGVEHIVQRHCQLHHPQRRSKVPCRIACTLLACMTPHNVHDVRPELLAQLTQLSEVEVLQVYRVIDSVLQSRHEQIGQAVHFLMW